MPASPVKRTSALHALLQRAAPLGCVVLLVASTLNGLSTDVTVAGRTVTIRPDQIVLLMLVPLVVSTILRGGVRLERPMLHAPFAGLLLANATASVLVSPLRAMSLQGVVLMSVYVGMYFAVVVLLSDRAVWVRRMSAILVGLGCVQAAAGLGAFLLWSAGLDPGGVRMNQVVRGSPSVNTTFEEGNLLGAFLALIAVLLATFLMSAPGGTRRRALFAGFCLVSLTLVLTLTRAAWIALLLAVLVLASERLVHTRSPRQTIAALAPVLAGLAVVLIVSLVVLDPLLSRVSGEATVLRTRAGSLLLSGDPNRTSTVAVGSRQAIVGRIRIFRDGLRGWQERPFLGHGTFAGEAINRRYWLSSVVQALYDTGLVGTAALLAMYSVVILIPWRSAARATDQDMRDRLVGCATGNAVLMFTSLFSSFLWVGFPWVFMGITMAIVNATRTGLARSEIACNDRG